MEFWAVLGWSGAKRVIWGPLIFTDWRKAPGKSKPSDIGKFPTSGKKYHLGIARGTSCQERPDTWGTARPAAALPQNAFSYKSRKTAARKLAVPAAGKGAALRQTAGRAFAMQNWWEMKESGVTVGEAVQCRRRRVQARRRMPDTPPDPHWLSPVGSKLSLG
eukprot:1160180-Pelagomonas_calceolata.AAC.9